MITVGQKNCIVPTEAERAMFLNRASENKSCKTLFICSTEHNVYSIECGKDADIDEIRDRLDDNGDLYEEYDREKIDHYCTERTADCHCPGTCLGECCCQDDLLNEQFDEPIDEEDDHADDWLDLDDPDDTDDSGNSEQEGGNDQ